MIKEPFQTNLSDVLIWQYNEATKLQELVKSEQANYDNFGGGYISKWFDDVYNFNTANEFGLNIWAVILGITFTTKEVKPKVRAYGYGSYRKNYLNANYSPMEIKDIKLTLEQKRLIIKLTYLKRFVRPTEDNIKFFLRAIFENDKRVNIKDKFDMTGGLVMFTKTLPNETLDIIKRFDLIPRPAGVEYVGTVRRKAYGYGGFRKNYYKANYSKNEIFKL